MKRFLILLLLFFDSALAVDPGDLALQGDYSEAASGYLGQAMEAKRKGRNDVAVPAMLNAATCMKMSGDVSAAALHLETVREWMGPDAPPPARLEWLALKGSVQALSKRPATALPVLREALALAEDHGDSSLRIDILNDLGIAHSAAGKHEASLEFFGRALELSAGSGGSNLLRARQNHLIARFQVWSEVSGLYKKAVEVDAWTGETELRLQVARTALEADLSATVVLLSALKVGDSSAFGLRLSAAMVAQRSGSVELANRLYAIALEEARKLGDAGFECGALMGLAEQYVEAKRHEDALRLLEEVRPHCAELPGPEAARLEILTAECRHASAPAAKATGDAIHRAISAVEGIRSDLARSQNISDLGRGFREFAGRPYLLLADHLLRYGVEGNQVQRLREARDAMEKFKTWELNDFYRDDCVNLALESARDLDRLQDPQVAVIHVIPLDDRTELLVGHDSGLRRFTSPIGNAELLSAARRLRFRLESDYGTFRFLEDSELLHRHLIQPALGHLHSLGVKHLVFVLDGALGNVPPAALFDAGRERYLLEDFSISIAPNLSLLTSPPAVAGARPILAGGLSEAVGDFPAIPAVDAEIENVSRLYPERVVLKNADFTTAALRENLLKLPADVVHLASHGEFLGRSEDCFFLTKDGKVSLDQLEEMIRPKKFAGIPVGLLCLSACRTAAGDDKAALGLAGAGVKSGARSVLATLWYVEDRVTAEIMTGFHQRLCNEPLINKAEALRQAQLEVLRKDSDLHPSFWAPFILVGSWK